MNPLRNTPPSSARPPAPSPDASSQRTPTRRSTRLKNISVSPSPGTLSPPQQQQRERRPPQQEDDITPSNMSEEDDTRNQMGVERQWNNDDLRLFFGAYNKFKWRTKTTRTSSSGSTNERWVKEATNYMNRSVMGPKLREGDVEALYRFHEDNIDSFDSAVELIAAHRSLMAHLEKMRNRSKQATKPRQTPPSSRKSRTPRASSSASAKRKTPSLSAKGKQQREDGRVTKRVRRILQFDNNDGAKLDNSASTMRKRKQRLVPTPLPPDADNEIFNRSLRTSSNTPTSAVTDQESQTGSNPSDVISEVNSCTSQSSTSDTSSSPISATPNADTIFQASTNNTNANTIPSSPTSKLMKKRLEKRLPLKLRGKGTHGGLTNKVITQILESSESPNFQSGDLEGGDQQLLDQTERMGQQFVRLLTHPKARKFLRCEWFYSNIDYGYFKKNDFLDCLDDLGVGDVRLLTRTQWTYARSLFPGPPRRFSKKFLADERKRLNDYRNAVRMYYEDAREKQAATDDMTLSQREQQRMFHLLDDWDIVHPLSEGSRCLVYNVETSHIHVGTVTRISPGTRDTAFKRQYLVHLDHEEESKSRFFDDNHVMPFAIANNIGVDAASSSSDVMSDGKRRRAQYWESSTLFEVPPTPASPSRSRIRTPIRNSQIMYMSPPPPTLSPAEMPKTPQTLRNGAGEVVTLVNNDYIRLVHTLASDTELLAGYVFKINKKQRLIQELSEMNDAAEKNKQANGGVLQLDEQFTTQYARIISQIQENNNGVNDILNTLHQYRNASNHSNRGNTTVGNGSQTQAIPQAIRHTECQGLFNGNRDTATRAVEIIRQETLSQIVSSSRKNEQPSSSSSSSAQAISTDDTIANSVAKFNGIGNSILLQRDLSNNPTLQTISECAAYLMHVRSCVENQTMNAEEAILILNAAVMAIKPTRYEDEELHRLYGDIDELANQIKNRIVQVITQSGHKWESGQ